jgi:hypothetical protein
MSRHLEWELFHPGITVVDVPHSLSLVDPSIMNTWKEENYLYDPSYGSTVGNYLPDSKGPFILCLSAVSSGGSLNAPSLSVSCRSVGQ